MDDQKMKQLFLEDVQELGSNYRYFSAFCPSRTDWYIKFNGTDHQIHVDVSIHRTEEEIKTEIKQQLLFLGGAK
jgi:hypothetical protein